MMNSSIARNPTDPLRFTVFALVTLVAGAVTFVRTSLADDLRADTLDSAVRQAAGEFMGNHEAVGLSIGILREGKAQTYHFGTTERGKEQLPTADTLYAIGSVTKTFTGALLAAAVVEKQVNLDDDVREYLDGAYPNLEFNGQPVRLWQLLNHTSGLPRSLPDSAEWQIDPSADIAQSAAKEAAFLERYKREDFFRDLRDVKLTQTPGEKFSYSNAAAQLAGLVLERVYNKSFEELLRSKITGPLEMRDTTAELTAEQTGRLANAYCASGAFAPALSTRLPAAASLKSTTADMMKYVAWQLAETDEVVKLSHRPAGTTVWSGDNSFTVGLNWQILNASDRRRVFQNGSVPGYSSVCVLYPERKLGVVVLTNEEVRSKPLNLTDLADQILKEIIRE